MPASFRTPFRSRLVVAILALLLAAGGPVLTRLAAAQEDVTLTYFTFSAAPDHEEDLAAMIAAFEEQNPGITVDVQTAPFDDYFTELQTRIAGGDAPDVFELNYENFVSYASRDALLDLTDLAAAEADLADRFYPRAYEAFQLDGKQYGLPASFSNVVLFYNKDLFDAAGVEYPTADWTWEDELAAAQTLTNEDEGVWGTYSPIQFFEFFKVAAQSGCGVFGENGEVTIDQPGCVESLQWMVDKVNEYNVTPSDEELAGVANEDLFEQGKLAMLHSGIWMFSAFEDAPFAWDIALEPGNTQKAHHFFANAVAVSSDSENPEQAFAWSQFFTSSPEAAGIRIASSWELPALADQALFDEYLAQSPPESREVVFEALESLVTPPVVEQQAQMQDAITQALDLAKSGDLSPEEALAQAKTEVEAIVEQSS